jgi:hypothetical protein
MVVNLTKYSRPYSVSCLTIVFRKHLWLRGPLQRPNLWPQVGSHVLPAWHLNHLCVQHEVVMPQGMHIPQHWWRCWNSSESISEWQLVLLDV